jgi:D-glycero-D-manno-heptose 1,7-bisphosphate phosphatase
MATKKLILFDRDGVLNQLVVDHGRKRATSPLSVSDVRVSPSVPELLFRLSKKGYLLAIATNQPGAAKGEASRQELERVHARVVELCEAGGAKFSGHYICWHRAEDLCECRKPKPGLLLEAFRDLDVQPENAWIIGDRWVDMQAGVTAGARTCFWQGANPFEQLSHEQLCQVDLIVSNLADFAAKLTSDAVNRPER